MELIMKSESVQMATCFCYGPYPTEKKKEIIRSRNNFSTIFLYVLMPCIAFIQLLHLILLVNGKGKRSVQFYFIHLLYPIYLPILLQQFCLFSCLLSMYRLTIYLFIILQLYFLLHLILILFNNLILLLLQYVYFFFFSELGD